MILEQCKGVHCVDLGESFPKSIFLLNFASIQPRTSLVKIAGEEPCNEPSAVLNAGARPSRPLVEGPDPRGRGEVAGGVREHGVHGGGASAGIAL